MFRDNEIRPWILTLCPVDVLCSQTQIYEAEYETEHNDHKHTLQENRRLRKKREEMRQQVALLQEQVVFELLSLSSCIKRQLKHNTYTHTHMYCFRMREFFREKISVDLDWIEFVFCLFSASL